MEGYSGGIWANSGEPNGEERGKCNEIGIPQTLNLGYCLHSVTVG